MKNESFALATFIYFLSDFEPGLVFWPVTFLSRLMIIVYYINKKANKEAGAHVFPLDI